MGRGRTVTGVAALVAGAMLALAGNELARAAPSSSPFPPAVVAAAPAPAAASEPPAVGGGAEAQGGPEPADDATASTAVDPGPAEPDRPAPRSGVTEPDQPAPKPGVTEPDPPAPRSGAAEPAASEPDPAPAPDPSAGDPPAEPRASGPSGGEPKPVDPQEPDPAAATPKAEPKTEPKTEPKAPAPAAPATAAERHRWGTPLPGSDEFGYTGEPDPAKWHVAGECWAGHAGNGGRCASRSTVDGSKLVQTGLANGDSAWLASKVDQRYGRWEARVRSRATGAANGRPYHPLLIVWPSSDRWPEDGEYDFLENGAPGQHCAEGFIHYPHDAGVPVQQEFIEEKDCGAPLSEWHNIAFEWTPDHVRGYINGKKWFDLSGGAGASRRNIQDMPSGHLTIQLDNFFGGNMQPATYEVDWVRIYRLR